MKSQLIQASLVCFCLIGMILGNANAETKAELTQERQEVTSLEKLPQAALEVKAKEGDPLAGLSMANQLSDESQTLASVPVLANSAAEDAARWYSLAARMGALENRPLTRVSVRPLRATRKPRR